MKKMLPMFVVLLIVVGGVSFYGGMKYAGSKRAANINGAAGFRSDTVGMMGVRRGAGNLGGGFATGEILSKDDNSIIIKLRDGGSQIILFSTSTQIMKSSAGFADDLKEGENVSVNGITNPDGSVVAQSIQLRPAMTASSTK